MNESGQTYFEHPDNIPAADRQRYIEAEIQVFKLERVQALREAELRSKGYAIESPPDSR